MRFRRWTTVLLACLAPLAAAQDRPAEPVAVLEWPDGRRQVRRPAELDLEAIAEEGAAFLRLEGLQAPPGPAPGQAARVTLARGERVHVEVLGGDGDLLELGLAGGARLDVLVDRVRGLVFSGRVPVETLAGLVAPETGDLLHWLRPGGTLDRVPGTLLAFEPEGPRMEGSFGERVFPWSEVAALFIEPLGGPPALQSEGSGAGLRPGALVAVDLADGGRLRGLLRSLGAGGLRLEHAPGREVDLSLAALGEVVAEDGRVRFVSDLEPTRVEEASPFGDDLGLTWPYRRDLSVTGVPLRAGGRSWSRGLGVHAPSRLVYALDGAWAGLRGSVAVDDQVLLLGARGSVEFRVVVDGETRWTSGVVRGGEPPLEIPPVDLEGARELELVVDMAEDHYVADRADWLRLLLVRAP
jgi:hypothetical protein